jgi:predicted TIM-barrel fold metal-dependent hydrolase
MYWKKTSTFRFAIPISAALPLWLWLMPALAAGDEPLPLFDVHTHYKWDQTEITSPQQALAFLDAAGVKRALVIGTPANLALRLKRLAPERIVAFYGPYLIGGEKLAWQFRKALVDEVRQGLETGQYDGIGELHFIGGMATRWQRSKVFLALLALAREYDVPLMVHTEYSSIKPTISMCQANPQNRLLLAHAGAVLPPRLVGRILDACPNVTMDLAARDPWRYVRTPIADEQGRLLPDWEALVLKYPTRFMVGSDTVWPVDKGSSWDEADSGWQALHRFIDFHRRWLSFLPPKVAEAVRWRNAERLFARPGSRG